MVLRSILKMCFFAGPLAVLAVAAVYSLAQTLPAGPGSSAAGFEPAARKPPTLAKRSAPSTPLEMALRLERELAQGTGALLPFPELTVRLNGDTIPLSANQAGFPPDFLAGLIPETAGGIDVWRATLSVDDDTGGVVFYNADGDVFWTVAADQVVYSPDWVVRHRTPSHDTTDYMAFFARRDVAAESLAAARSRAPAGTAGVALEELRALRRYQAEWSAAKQYYRPSRVEMTFTFVMRDDLADFRNANAAPAAVKSAPRALAGLAFTSITNGPDTVSLTAAWPAGMVFAYDALDLFFTQKLAPPAWTNLFRVTDVSSDGNGIGLDVPRSALPPPPEVLPAVLMTNIVQSSYDPGVLITNIISVGAVQAGDSGFFRLADLHDSDNDGLTDAYEEWVSRTNPGVADTDGDGMADGWEILYGFDPLSWDDPGADPDSDGLTNAEECAAGTDPFNADTDSDGLTDGEEVGTIRISDGQTQWHDVSGGTDLTETLFGGWGGVMVGTPPFPVTAGCVMLNGISVSPNGIVSLSREWGNGIGWLDRNEDLTVAAIANNVILLVVAGFWDSLWPAPGSAVTLADVNAGGRRHCVVEYRDMQVYDPGADGAVSFQVVFTEGESNVVRVLFGNMRGAGDGQSATLGVQMPGLTQQYACNTPGAVCPCRMLTYLIGVGTNPLLRDTDGDKLDDMDELALGTAPLKSDTDGDGLSDGDEVNLHGTNPLWPDTDGDGLPDGWEVAHAGFDPNDPSDGLGDPDGDGLSTASEIMLHLTDPNNPDSDGDGLSDGAEVNTHRTDPNNPDTDGDGLWDGDELDAGTDPLNPDTDGDGLADGIEVALQSVYPCINPLVWDSDGDMLPDGWEIQHGLDPCSPESSASLSWDADADGLGLFDEYRYGTDPGNPDTDGDGVSDGDEVTPRPIPGYSLNGSGGFTLLAAGGGGGPISNPTDASDMGSPANCVTVKLTVGDPSTSYSERWIMEVREDVSAARPILHCDEDFGMPGSGEYALVKGKTYVFKLQWVDTNLYYDDQKMPDFDWRCLINDSAATGARVALHSTGVIIVEDDDSLLTDETHGNDENITKGRQGKIHVPKIETKTVAEQPPDRSRKTIGVGEEVELTLKPSGLGMVTWSISSGAGQLNQNGSNGNTVFTAPSEASDTTVTATIDGSTCSVDFNIIEPSGLFFENIAGSLQGMAAPSQRYYSIAYYADVYILPDTVNFYNISICEGFAQTQTDSGYFQDHPPPAHTSWEDAPRPINNMIVVSGKGTLANWNQGDTIGGTTENIQKVPLCSGYAYWDIPWKYRVASTALKQFTTVRQDYRLIVTSTNDVTFRITKRQSGAEIHTGDTVPHFINP